jgi:arginase family enzyme
MEGLLKNDTNIHAGIRTTLSGMSDYDNDGYVGFEIVEAREIDTIGTAGIIKKIHDRVGELLQCWYYRVLLILTLPRRQALSCLPLDRHRHD